MIIKFTNPNNALRLYAGILSFVCAETLTGASLYWVLNPIAYVLAFPIYLTHVLFFYSLAHHCGHKDIVGLYLFGILFALYESWVTKVLWAGYPGEDGFVIGAFLGHGIHETSVLLLYFHSIVAFIFPLALMSILFPSVREEIGLHRYFFGGHRIFRFLFWFSFIVLAFGPSQQFASLLHPPLHWVPTLLLVYGGYKMAQRTQERAGGAPITFALSVRGTKIAGGIILAIYVLTYFLLLPERLPSLPVQGLTALIYLGVIALIFHGHKKEWILREAHLPTPYQLFLYLVVMCIATTCVFVIRVFAPDIVKMIAAICFLLMMPVGCYLFWDWVLKPTLSQRKHAKN